MSVDTKYRDGSNPAQVMDFFKTKKAGKGFTVEAIAEATGLDKGVVAGTASVIARFNGHLVKVEKGVYRKASQADLDSFAEHVPVPGANGVTTKRVTSEDLEGQTVKELRADAKAAGVTGFSKMAKKELIDAIVKSAAG